MIVGLYISYGALILGSVTFTFFSREISFLDFIVGTSINSYFGKITGVCLAVGITDTLECDKTVLFGNFTTRGTFFGILVSKTL